jgi:LysR family pca operon transcriptional activator
MRHLRCFNAVARYGNVTRAAEELGTVQPSVSRSIRELEEILDTPLFERGASGMVLTEAGTTFSQYVSSGMNQIDRGIEALRGQIASTKVRAYILPNVVRVIMPGAVQRYKSLYPNIDLEFLPTTGGGLQENLMQGKVDFGFGRLIAAEHMSGLNFEYLYSEALRFFVRSDHPLATAKDVTVQDIDTFPVVLPSVNTIIRSEIDSFLISQGLSKLSNVIETLSFEFARNLMLESNAVVCHPLGAMRRELDEGRVVALDYASEAMVGAVGITTPAETEVSAAAQLLIQAIREEVRSRDLL